MENSNPNDISQYQIPTNNVVEPPVSTPTTDSIIEQKTSKRFPVKWIMIILLSIAVCSTGYFYYTTFFKKHLATNSSATTGTPVSQKEWAMIADNVGQSTTLLQAIPRQFATAHASQDPAQSSQNSVESSYQSLQKIVQPKPLVATIASDTPHRTHFGFTFSGTYEEKNKDPESFAITTSMIQLSTSAQNQVDVIMNGSWNGLDLSDSGIDAVHTSIINTATQSTTINVEASDYSIVLLNRLKKPQQSTTSKKIEINTDDIYPYFGEYVEIPSEALNQQFPKQATWKDEFMSEVLAAFKATVGNVDNYINQDSEKIKTDGPLSNLKIVVVDLNQDKFANTLNSFIDAYSQITIKHQADFKAECSNQSDSCLSNAGFLSQEDARITKLSTSALFKLVAIKKFGLFVDSDSYAVRGFIADISQKESLVSSVIDLPIQKGEMSMSYYDIDDPSGEIFIPTDTKKPQDPPPAEIPTNSDKNNKIYQDNKAYIRGLNNGIWSAIMTSGAKFCNQWWQPSFCVNNPTEWRITEPNEFSNAIHFTFPSDSKYGQPYIGVEIEKIDRQFTTSNECYYEEIPGEFHLGERYSFYKDLTTNQGLHLRISLNKQSDGNYIGAICMPTKKEYSKEIPIEATIAIHSESFDQDSIAEKVSTLLSSFEISTTVSEDMKLKTPDMSISSNFPERKHQISRQMKAINFENETVNGEYLYINGAPDDKTSCHIVDKYIIHSYKDPDKTETVVVLPTGQAVCMSSNNCAVCNSGSLEWEPNNELDKCKNLRCNP
jgi:hypothetical protein